MSASKPPSGNSMTRVNLAMSEEDTEISLDSLFPEPPRPPTPNTTIATYIRERLEGDRPNDWKKIEIRLIGEHPLWGNYLWNAARALATYLDEFPDLYRNKNVLELGAAGALPSIVAAKNGARNVVITDYPDDSLIKNIKQNVESNVDSTFQVVSIHGYIWGRPVASLLDAIAERHFRPGFDLIILSDLIFNHSQHDALLDTCEQTLSTNLSLTGAQCPSILVFYSHHRPHLAHQDLQFFGKATSRGWNCEKILTRKYPVMFPDDSGDEDVRATVHGWRLVRS